MAHYVVNYIYIKTKATYSGFRVSFTIIEKTSCIKIIW